MKNRQVILIVDDTSENLQVLGNLLEEEYEVRIAINGADALQSVNESVPDLILLDILMPVMGGYEANRMLKADDKFKLIPVIFISALGMTEQKVEAFREGAVDYITKPFQTEEVLARVHTHLQLSKMEALKHEIAERLIAEELLKQQNEKLEYEYEKYKRLSEELQKSNDALKIAKDHAEESDRLKTAFVQNISHELRTPLNGILGFSSLLENEKLKKDDIRTYNKIIKTSSDRLLETVNNILDIAKIDSGQIEVQKKNFAINSTINDLFEFFSPMAKKKNIALNFKNELSDENSIVSADEQKLYQILTNLINNSIKFTSKGQIDFGYTIENKLIKFYVKDTGIGIPKEWNDKIFARFTQGETSASRGYEGTGLGLSISKGLVNLLGGTIWFESKIDEGTTFYFTIPFSSTNEACEPVKETLITPEITIHGKILIVEDDAFSFIYLNELLKNPLIQIMHAKNGKEALEITQNTHDIDLILMDMKMPVMDGFEATIEIKKIEPKLPIIAQTAFSFKKEIEKIMAAGCDDYISKPIKNEDLINVLMKYMKTSK